MVSSTVHEIITRESEGDFRHLSVAEGGVSSESGQQLKRRVYEIKYLQSSRAVTRQMEVVDTFENAMASETIAGIDSVIKGEEHLCLHGDSSVVPTEYDGFISSITKAPKEEQNIIDLKGGKVTEDVFNEVAQRVYEKGAYLTRALYPPILANQIADIYRDKVRYMVGDKLGFFDGLPSYPTAIGAKIDFQGDGAGADRFYQIKGIVKAEGDKSKRPSTPTSITATAGTATCTIEDGKYRYKAFAINSSGISEGKEVAAPVVVAGNVVVNITITRASDDTTGYIICRSKKDDTTGEPLEMVRIPCDGEATTYVDKNEDLPGSASMLFLADRKIQPAFTFAQLLPACKYPLYPTNAAVTPFLIMLYGSLEVRVPKFCGLVKNIGGF